MPSYEQSGKSKLWSVRFREQKEDGTLINKRLSGFKTKKEAQTGYIEYLNSKDKKKQAAEMTFSELVNNYLAFFKTRVKETSYYDIEGRIKNHMLPRFGTRRVDTITSEQLLLWTFSLQHYSYEFQKSIISRMKTIYSFGARYYGIDNTAQNLEIPRRTQLPKEMQIYSPDEFRAFISAVNDYQSKMFFRFLYESGCRRGEAEALNWNDFNFESCSVRINKSLTRKVRSGIYMITSPKNSSSVRTISLTQDFCNEMLKYQKWQKENFSATDFVFGSEKPISHAERVMSAASAAAGVKKIRVHDLRHSCASLLISRGVSIVAVSKRLGHASIEQTLQTYTHLLPDDEARTIAVLSDIFDNDNEED